MAHLEEEVEQDLSHIHWSWPEAIAANPARSLATPDLAMDYFAYSPFFDHKSNNSVLRTQRRVENPTYGHAEEKIELNAFRSGFEYIVSHSQPPNLFVIHRREVQSDGSRDNVSAAYFILHDKVYPTPTVYDVIATRLKNASHLISSTFSTLSAAHPPSNPRAPSTWRSLPPSTSAKRDGAAASSSAAAAVESGEGGDVIMGSPSATTPAAPVDPSSIGVDETGKEPSSSSAAGKEKEKEKETATGAAKATSGLGPDWFLVNALASTRSALDELDDLARRPRPSSAAGVDPMGEARAPEYAQRIPRDRDGSGPGSGSGRSGSAQPQTGEAKPRAWPTVIGMGTAAGAQEGQTPTPIGVSAGTGAGGLGGAGGAGMSPLSSTPGRGRAMSNAYSAGSGSPFALAGLM
ncbi:Mediator complex subunit 6, partial [Saitozyma sp. JCM 24511]